MHFLLTCLILVCIYVLIIKIIKIILSEYLFILMHMATHFAIETWGG